MNMLGRRESQTNTTVQPTLSYNITALAIIGVAVVVAFVARGCARASERREFNQG
jgi:hypothetical protein